MQKFSQGKLTEAMIECLRTSEHVGYSGGILFVHEDHKDQVIEELSEAIAQAIVAEFTEPEPEPESDGE